MDEQVPHQYLCPITLNLMDNPVTNVHGHTFDRDAIMKWHAQGNRKNPLTNINLPTFNLSPDKTLKAKIDSFRMRNQGKQKGFELKQQTIEQGENEEIQNSGMKEKRVRKLFGTISERMQMKKKQIIVFKHNFELWKKEFDQYMNDHENIVTVLGNKLYLGQMRLGRRHGKGICYYRDGSRYYGEWLHDYYYGKGIFISPSNKTQYGEWKLGDLTGLGMYEDDVGFVYEGDLKHGSQSGWGVVYKENKIYFEGEWKFGLRHGKGIRHMQNQKFEGLWRYGVRHGSGILILNTGKRYQQKWFHGEMSKQSEECQ